MRARRLGATQSTAALASLALCLGCSDFEVRRAVAWLGYPPAQTMVADMYASGSGVPEDDAEAFRWYRRAAERGYSEAQYALGLVYLEGEGVSRDLAAAERWLEASAEQGFAEAQARLGKMYLTDDWLPRDDERALAWLRRARTVPEAQNDLGFLYARRAAERAGDPGASFYRKESVRWLRESARAGYPPAQYNLGMVYLRGEGVEKSDSTGRRWLRVAASQGYVRAERALAKLGNEAGSTP